jgi:uncharacterized SAM-binding protein YcdF (DUF218 family)
MKRKLEKSDDLRFAKPRLCRALLALTLCVIVVTFIWPDPLFQGLAGLWIVSETVEDADAAVVLGGGLETRPFAAAELYRNGFVRRVLISRVPAAFSYGIPVDHTELNRRVLLERGVPASAIEVFGMSNKNTRDEAVALREWAKRNRLSTFVIPTEIFSTRRVQLIFRRELAATMGQVKIQAVEPKQYTQFDWWKSKAGVLAFQAEALKYCYYDLAY